MSTFSKELSLLEARGLVRVTLENEKPIVRFKHALTREATYNSILQARRGELHRAVAQTLSRLSTEPDLESALTIAEHWQRGGSGGRALATVLPPAQAIIYTGRGSSLSTLLERLDRTQLTADQQRDLDLTLADASAARGEYEAARALYASALSNAASPALRARALYGLGVSEYRLGNYARAAEYQRENLTLAEETQDLIQQARATSGLGAAVLGMGEFDRALEYFESSRALSVRGGFEMEQANAEANIAVALFYRGHYQQAIEAAERVLAIHERLGNSIMAARTFPILGASYYSIGNLDIAEMYYRRAYESSKATGDGWNEAESLSNLAELYGERGELGRAAETYRQALDVMRRIKYDLGICFSLTGLADVELRQARSIQDPVQTDELMEHAQSDAETALTLARQLQLREREGSVLRVLAEIQAAREERQAALASAKQAVEILEQAGQTLECQRAYRTYGQLLAASRDAADQANSARFLALAEKGA